jgi:hypothetical protein
MEQASPWEFFQVPQYSWNVKEDNSVWLTEVDYVLIRFTVHAIITLCLIQILTIDMLC